MELTLTYELDQFEPLYAADKAGATGTPKAGNDRPGADWLRWKMSMSTRSQSTTP